MKYLPIFLQINGENCLVVGGGTVAARKTATLMRAGGKVTVLAPELGTEISALVAEGRVMYRNKHFAEDDVTGFRVVISATNHRDVNTAVYEAATRRCIPVNVVDCPELCTFIFPAIVDRSPVVIAISTGGASPVLARVIRTRLEQVLPPAYGRLAAWAETFRNRVKETLTHPDVRRRFWEQTLQGPVADLVLTGHEEEAEQQLIKLMDSTRQQAATAITGFVTLVGAGPGVEVDEVGTNAGHRNDDLHEGPGVAG